MTTTFTDRWGVPVQATDGTAVVLLDQAIEDLLALRGDPAGGAAAAAAADPTLALARICRAYLSLQATTADGITEARELLAPLGTPARELPEREARHLAAARAWADGDWHAATRSLGQALLASPRDLLALKVAQDLYFLLGSRLELRDVAARVLPAWPRNDPAWGYVQGIYAFGLQENADYRRARKAARGALARNPRDAWSVHALAHVYEMKGSHKKGVELLTTSSPRWEDSSLAVRNWWHLGLFLLEAGRVRDALALYDERVRPGHCARWRDIVDAAALLWRLSLYGQDVSTRAQALAADIEPLAGAPVYLFNDWHAVMTFGLAGEHARAAAVRAANHGLTAPSNKHSAERAGLTLLEAFSAFSAGDPGRTAGLLSGIRQEASAVGGSHAQRDVIDLTLLAAAVRSGSAPLARALVTERVARKPSAGPSARALVAANGGDDTWLAW